LVDGGIAVEWIVVGSDEVAGIDYFDGFVEPVLVSNSLLSISRLSLRTYQAEEESTWPTMVFTPKLFSIPLTSSILRARDGESIAER
jgi:hypothetical protein